MRSWRSSWRYSDLRELSRGTPHLADEAARIAVDQAVVDGELEPDAHHAHAVVDGGGLELSRVFQLEHPRFDVGAVHAVDRVESTGRAPVDPAADRCTVGRAGLLVVPAQQEHFDLEIDVGGDARIRAELGSVRHGHPSGHI